MSIWCKKSIKEDECLRDYFSTLLHNGNIEYQCGNKFAMALKSSLISPSLVLKEEG